MAEAEYTVLHRRRIRSVTLDGEDRTILAITYKAAGLPPRTIFIPEADWREDIEKTLILEDIQKFKGEIPK